MINNALLAIALLAWLSSGSFREKGAAFRHPIAVVAIVLYVLMMLQALFGASDIASAAIHLRKYDDLLLIPIFLYLFRDACTRDRSVIAMALGLAFVLLISYLIAFGVPLWVVGSIRGNPSDPVAFKQHLTHNILMAFGVFLFAWLAVNAATRRARLGWGILTMLALVNVTLMVQGATGYLVLIGLSLLLGFRCVGWRGLAWAGVGMAVLAFTLMATTNPFEQRVNKVIHEFREWRPDTPADTSTGWRLEFYRNTLSIIAAHPLLGVGTGGFAQAYAEKVQGTGAVPTQNPHNEFLLMWAQLGIAGVVLLVWLFWRQWRLAARLPTRLERELARGLIVTMVIGCMLNSLLLDHTEGLFYAWLTGVLYGGLKSRDPSTDPHFPKSGQAGNAAR